MRTAMIDRIGLVVAALDALGNGGCLGVVLAPGNRLGAVFIR